MKKIIVFGGGQVGSSVAKILSDDGNDITLVDYDKDVLSSLQEKMDIKTIHGLASYPSVQKLADAENCDMVIAVTGSDEVNMAACHVAKSIYNVPKRIARLRANEYLRDEDGFDKSHFSISEVITPINHRLCKKYFRSPWGFPNFSILIWFSTSCCSYCFTRGPAIRKKII